MQQKKSPLWHRLRLAALLLPAVALAACGPLREFIAPTAPAVSGEWAVLLGEIRDFERRIGFTPTANFNVESKEQAAFHYCGHADPLTLPWSYEDPAIQWENADSESACRALAPADDIYFRRLEARGEAATPVTSAMLAGKLDRFVYLVIHEDCHDQFALPWGVEEALCDFITHRAMSAFAESRYAAGTREQRSIIRYAETQARQAHATIDWYGRLERLYAQHRRGEISNSALLETRAELYATAERPLGFARGELNNIGLASNMTYSRYYPLMEEAFDANARELARSVAFFRKLDAVNPAQTAAATDTARSVESLRAGENAVIDRLRAALRQVARESL